MLSRRVHDGGGPLVLGNVGVGDVAHVVVQAADLLDVDHRGCGVGDDPRVFEGVVGGLAERDADAAGDVVDDGAGAAAHVGAGHMAQAIVR